jgi:hypothetical protein
MGKAWPKQWQMLLKMCPKQELSSKCTKGPIYRKLVYCQVIGLHSITLMHAFNCTPCDQTQITTTAHSWKRWNRRAG